MDEPCVRLFDDDKDVPYGPELWARLYDAIAVHLSVDFSEFYYFVCKYISLTNFLLRRNIKIKTPVLPDFKR